MKNTKKSRIIAYFRSRCPHRMKFPDGEDYYCQFKYQSRCKNPNWFVDYPDCSDTCPHHIRRVPIGCDDNTKCNKLEIEYKKLCEVLKDN